MTSHDAPSTATPGAPHGPGPQPRPAGEPRAAAPGGARLSATTTRILEALRAGGPASQATLARRVGLSPATVSGVVRELREQGVAETVPVDGRESLVSLVAREGVFVSVQLGTEGVRAALFDFGRGVRHDRTVRLPDRHDGGSPELVAGLVTGLARDAGLDVGDLHGVAVGVEAPIARPAGAVAGWAQVQLTAWRDVPIEDWLQARLGVPVLAENDANLAALAEWSWGVGRGAGEFVHLICSTGIGGGIVLGGDIYGGSDGLAGELGHVVLEPDGPVCFCGNRGCLAMFASERSILLALEASGGPQRSLSEVIVSARRGDPACRAVLAEVGRHLGRAIAGTARLLSPAVVAVGGTLSEAGTLLFDSLLSSPEVVMLRGDAPLLRIEPAGIRVDATLLGGVAALLGRLGRGISELPDWARRPSSGADAPPVDGANAPPMVRRAP